MAKKNKLRMVSLAIALAVGLLGSDTVLAGTTTSLVSSNVVNSSGVNGTTIEITGLNSTNVMVNFFGGSGGIINWSSLGVGSGERLQFAFSGTAPTAAVLNRVTGSDLSQIAGTIASDGGKVFLVNPNGIIFTSGASINAPLFVASTLAVTDTAFSNYATDASSSLPFSTGTGAIQVNDLSVVESSNVALIAPTVTVAPGVTFTSPVAVVQANTAIVASDGSVSVPTLAPTVTNPVIQAQQSTTSTLVTMFTSSGGTLGETNNAPQTVEATDSGGALFSVISPGSATGGAGTSGAGTGGTTGSGTPVSGPSALGGSGTGGTPPVDAFDRALSAVANPPPVQGASQPGPHPPQTTTTLAQGLSQMATGRTPPAGAGVPGIRGGFSSSGNPGRW